jgi:hypothetical protein
VYIGFLNNIEQCLFRSPAWFEQTGKVASLAQPRNLQFNGSDPRIPFSAPVSVSVILALSASFETFSTDELTDLGVHHRFDEDLQTFPQKIDISILQTHLANEL